MVAATTLFDSADAAFERLFADEYTRVASIAFRITRDRAEAEDVAQEVFLRVARGRRTGVQPAWLYRAAAHAALNAVRSRRRRALREAREFALRRPLDPAADPERVAESRAEAAMVRAALLRIGKGAAQILALRYGGLSYREVAEVLQIDAAQVGTRLLRAERALKREIERGTS